MDVMDRPIDSSSLTAQTNSQRPTSHFGYRGISPSTSKASLARIDGALAQVCAGIEAVDFSTLGVSEYNQRYLGEKLAKPHYEFSLLRYLFSYLLEVCPTRLEDATLIDYGAGSGLICLVAKALGIRNVIYSDIYDVSSSDAKKLGERLGLAADHYMTGETAELADLMQLHSLTSDLFVSHDCIEHIYDIESFVRDVSQLSGNRMAVWLSSAANPCRRKTALQLAAVAVRAEREGTPKTWGHKDRDSTRPFLEIRQEIIRDEASDLPSDVIDAIAHRTRGKIDCDIRAAVRAYRSHGVLPANPTHATNTCDPCNGHWAERLMDPHWLASICREHGIDVQVAPGYWSHDVKSTIKDVAKTMTNFAVAHLGRYSLRLAPYYVLRGMTSSPMQGAANSGRKGIED